MKPKFLEFNLRPVFSDEYEPVPLEVGDRFRIKTEQREGESYKVIRIHETPQGRMFIVNTTAKGKTSEIPEAFYDISLARFGDKLQILSEAGAKDFIAKTEAALEFLPDGAAIPFDIGITGIAL